MFIFLRRILFNLLLILFITFIVSFFRYFLLSSEYKIKNTYILDKYKQYKKGNFNTLFLGTSLTETGIIPDVYDSLNSNSNSYNLGVYGLSTIEYLKLSEFVIENFRLSHSKEKLKLKNIIFELRSPYHIRGLDLYERRNNIHFEDLKLISDICLHQRRIPLHRRITIFVSYFFSYLLNILNFGLLSDCVKENNQDRCYNKQGFYNPNSNSNDLIRFKMDTYQNVPKYDSNLLYVQSLKQIVKMAYKNNIQIIFWIPPNLPNWEIMDILGFKDYLSGIKVINANSNTLLLNQNIWLDKPHLNLHGAKLNTIYLGRSLNEIYK
jgi:hypothetical protein